MPPSQQQQKEKACIAAYLQQTGLATAIRDSLKSLFAEPRLPDNPYYYLASALGAYVDQNDLWQESDLSLLTALDNEGGLEVADQSSRLCKLAACGNVWGLPHMLRCVSKEGVRVVQDVLSNSLPDSFFPGPMPFSNKDGYTMQVLASVQGTTAVWRPQWMEFPELAVRADVVVRGPRLDEALGQLAGLLAADLADLDAVPVFFVQGLQLVAPLAGELAAAQAALAKGAALGQMPAPQAASSTAAASAGMPPAGFAGGSGSAGGLGSAAADGAAGGLWTLADMTARPDEFRKALSRGVLAHKCVELRAVLMLEAPADAAHLTERKLRFEVAVKRYVFHFWPTVESSAEQPSAATGKPGKAKAKAKTASSYSVTPPKQQVAHYGSTPHEVEACMLRGATLEGLRRMLLLVLLQDAAPLGPAPLLPSDLLPLEELLLVVPSNQAEMLLSVVPNLLRMINSGAGMIQGVVREMEAICFVTDAWPSRRQACTAHAMAAAEAAGLPVADMQAAEAAAAQHSSRSQNASNTAALLSGRSQQHDLAGQTPPAAAAAAVEASGPAATLAWLASFCMEGKVLQQLLGLKPRVVAATGSGIFSGISVILSQLLGQLPREVPADPEQCRAALAAARGCVESLQQLLEAAALTLADALLDRCRDVMWALHRFGVRLVDSVMARAALVADEGEATPEWVLHVGAITDAQIRSGAVAERVAREGVMLQYAVDTKLDVLLSSLYASVTQPPMPLNPYPRLLHFLRAHAARLDLWKEDMDDACAQLLNQLELLQPPGFIYAAKPPEGAARAGRRARQRRAGAAAAAGGGGGLDDDDSESATVYGSYAAVSLCDGRSLQSLASSLGRLLSERHWQQGGTSCNVLPALAGDAWLSGALGLAEGDDEGGAAAAAGGRQRTFGAAAASQRAPFEQPRFFRVDAEEHHQVSGPDLAQAATLFAAGVVDNALSLHQHTLHIVHQLSIGSSSFGLAAMLTQPGREAAVFALAKAVRSSAARHPATHADDCVAVLELLAAAKEGLYVRLVKHLHFAYQRDGLPHDTTNTAAGQHSYGSAPQPGFLLPAGGPGTGADAASCSTAAAAAAAAAAAHAACASPAAAAAAAAIAAEAEALEPHWCLGVYQRVFLTQSAAAAWQAWNSRRGDPAQPFHYHHMVQQVQQQVRALESSGGLLDAQKLLLCVVTAMQDVEALFNVSRAMMSAAQELRCLQEMNAALRLLLAHDLPAEQCAKLDTERCRALFLLYCGRLRRAMMSPKYCYFSGFAAAAPRLVSELKDLVLQSNCRPAGPRALAVLRQLDLWTLCCELSVAASVHDCFDDALKHRLLERLTQQSEG